MQRTLRSTVEYCTAEYTQRTVKHSTVACNNVYLRTGKNVYYSMPVNTKHRHTHGLVNGQKADTDTRTHTHVYALGCLRMYADAVKRCPLEKLCPGELC